VLVETVQLALKLNSTEVFKCKFTVNKLTNICCENSYSTTQFWYRA